MVIVAVFPLAQIPSNRQHAGGGVPTRDIAVGREGLKLTLDDTIVDVVATPGHTPGTIPPR